MRKKNMKYVTWRRVSSRRIELLIMKSKHCHGLIPQLWLGFAPSVRHMTSYTTPIFSSTYNQVTFVSKLNQSVNHLLERLCDREGMWQSDGIWRPGMKNVLSPQYFRSRAFCLARCFYHYQVGYVVKWFLLFFYVSFLVWYTIRSLHGVYYFALCRFFVWLPSKNLLCAAWHGTHQK